MASITLKNISKSFADNQVIKNVDLEINDGEFVVFVGPSGCGKSTLLRIISGLEDLNEGNIFIDSDNVTDKIPYDRALSMVFQSYALYPHMNVFENIGFSLKTSGIKKDILSKKVVEIAKILRLEDLLNRLPKQLSGGQKQRVAIGRAIIREPKAFLFDEPLSNLDATLRVEMRLEISRLHKKLGITSIYVTHDQVEAMTLADKIVVLNEGQIIQTGTPYELYNYPKNLFVAGFIGTPKMNILDCYQKDGLIYLEGDKDKKINLYLNVFSGEITAVRSLQWRIWDLMWGFHIMDWQTRDKINNIFLQIFSILALVSSISGIMLFFRVDFNSK